MLFEAIYLLLVLEAIPKCSSEISTPRYDLCEVGVPLTSENGSIYATLGGLHCTRVILAPTGYRIEVNVTKNTRIREQVDMFVYDGATGYDNIESARISRHRPLADHIAISTSNAVLIHIDKVISSNTNVDITYKMFLQPTERCQCLPVSHGNTVCSYNSQFYRDDTLYKYCTVSCGEDRYIVNRIWPNDFKIRCFMGDPEHDLHGEGNWNAVDHLEVVPDKQLVTCARIYPTTRLKLAYKFSYNNVSCVDVNETFITDKVREYISSIDSVSNAGECFKRKNIQGNSTCSVESVNITCRDSGGSAQIILTVRDNVINSTNETIVYQRYFTLYAAFYTDIVQVQKLIVFIRQNLTVNDRKASDVSYVYPRKPIEDCPNNAGYKPDYSKSRYGCVNCPPHFYKQETKFPPCQECENGTRRKNDEGSCVRGPRDYPQPSQTYCKHTCHLGKFYNSNSSLCEWCPYGTYQNSTTILNPVCTPCPDGLTTGFVGARNVSECIELCPAGSYLEYTRCVKCDIGYFMPNASNRFPKCYQCPTGFTTLGMGTTDGCVKKCSVGEYFNTTTRDCTLCPNNTYQDDTNDTNARNCKACPLNTITASTGSTMVSDCLGPCDPGQYIDINLKGCSPCPRNSYQNESKHVRFICKPCGQYQITQNTASTNVSECMYPCTKGEFFNLTSKSCEKCAIDTYQSEIGKDTCNSCQGKSFTLRTGSERCINPCQYGEFLNKSAEKCVNCSQGYYQNVSDHMLEVCRSCPLDFYNDKSGQRNCTACRVGTITLITTATSVAECIETCQRGYYLNFTRRKCEKCLKGFYQGQKDYRYESCTKCPTANLTTVASGASSVEECVGYCETSHCLNGGKCFNIDNDFNCSCPQHLTGKRCETVIDGNLSDKIEVSVRLPGLIWNENLRNPDSNEFKQLSGRIENSIRDEFESDATFRRVKVTGFREGSVISDVEFTYVAGVDFGTPVDTLTSVIADGKLGNLSVDNSSVTIVKYSCSQPLGMQNGRILDSAITSGVPRFYHPPKNARLNHAGPGWAPIYLSGDEVYLQVDFLEEVWLTGIATQGSSYDGGSWLQTFYFQTSSNGNGWSYYRGDSPNRYHLFTANDDVDTIVRNALPYPVKTRYVRIFEYDFKAWISYRVEFYGCPIPKTVPLPTQVPPPTQAPPPTPPPTQAPAPTKKPTLADEDDDDNVGLIVGIIFGVLAVCIIFIAVAWWITRRKRSRSFRSNVNVIPLKETH